MKNKWDSIIRKSLLNSANEIKRIAHSFDGVSFANIINMIMGGSGNIVVTGAGVSGVAARKIVHAFRSQELPAFFLSPADALHGASGVIQKDDLFIVISNGGKSKEINLLTNIAKKRGAVVLSVTSDPDSELGKMSDELLIISVQQESDSLNLLATASINCVIAVFDAICRVIMVERHFTKQNFAIIHPEGRVGEQILVDKQKEIPCLSE